MQRYTCPFGLRSYRLDTHGPPQYVDVMSEQVSVIGDGAMGTLCAIMLAENGVEVRLWSAFPDAAEELARTRENSRFLPGSRLDDSVVVTAADAEAFGDAELIISAVPTQYMRAVWGRLESHYPGDVPICSVAKGIENDTLLRPTQIVREVLGANCSVTSLSGPSIAPEVAKRLPATVAVASETVSLAEQVQRLLARPYFRVYTNPDLVGVEVAGATKNVIAIAAGILDGLDAGVNAKAALLTRGLVEITRLGVALGGQRETFAGLTGMGDLVTTCFSPVGRNRCFGQAIGTGQSVAQALGTTQSVVEGVPTTQSVVELAARLDVEMPITQAVHDVVFAGRSPDEAIRELMARPLKSES